MTRCHGTRGAAQADHVVRPAAKFAGTDVRRCMTHDGDARDLRLDCKKNDVALN